MKILSVNVSKGREISYMGKRVRTGIFKKPVNGRLMLRKLNLDGDAQSDLINHGGIYKAAYVYSVENYDFWKRELHREDFTFGQFGENFTVQGMLEDDIYIGEVFRVGSATVEVTQPRVPCYKLGIRMGLPEFPKLFLASGRVGFMLRVLREGELEAGDSFECLKVGPEQITVRKINHLLHFDSENVVEARAALRMPALSPGWRGSFEKRLAEAGRRIEYEKGAAGNEKYFGA
ncbi:MAG: MOSC domain-containing protein [Terriglobia bacterium]